MSQSQLKTKGLWCTFLIVGLLFGMTEQTNTSVVLSAVTSRALSSSGNASLSTTSTYDGSLYSTSPTFVRPYGISSSSYYYQAIQVTVHTSSEYTLKSSSSIDTYGCLYDTIFDPSNPQTNLVAYDDDSGGSGQFLINYYLQSGRTYILVVTTYSPSVYGSYSIIATGSYTVYMREIPVVTTTRSGYLSSSNSRFARPGGYSSSGYYYDSIEVTSHTSVSYTFRSSSSTSLDTYGCLYIGSFNPSYPSSNKLTCNDDSGGSLQFQFTQNLYSYNTYILVVTTSSAYTTGSYSVSVTGPVSVTMTTYTPDFDISVAAVIGIAIGCIAFCCLVLVLSICACRRRQQVVTRVTMVPAQYNPGARNVYYPDVHGNFGQGAPPPYNSHSIYPKV